jgi:hypothetical protein
MQRRVTLPQRCSCGAHGKVTLQEKPGGTTDEADAPLKPVAVEGPLGIGESGEIVCLACGESWR